MSSPSSPLRKALAAGFALAAVGLFAAEARAATPCGQVRFIATYDSHGLTPFGDRLDAYLMARPGSDLTSYTLGGATPEWLLRGTVSPRGYLFKSCDGQQLLPRAKLRENKLRAPVIEELIDVPEGLYERQVVILTVGSNVPGQPAIHTPKVEKLVRAVSARSDAICIWVGPPTMRTWSALYSEKVYQALRDGIRAAETGRPAGATGPACHLIDSRPLSEYPAGGDGTHYGFTRAGVAAATHWANGVIGEIERILAATPPSQARAPSQRASLRAR